MRLFLLIMLLTVLVGGFTSCAVYTEKQSEALSQAVYLADDSFEMGRFDVTDVSLDNAIRIVKPPKKKIEIKAIERFVTNDLIPTTTPTNTTTTKTERIIIVPEKFKNQQVIVVNSNEYQQLLKDKKIFEQLQTEHKALERLKLDIEQELAKQVAYNNKMVEDLNKLQKEVLAKRLHILKLYTIIAVMGLTMGGGIYLRMKGIL